MGSVSRQIRRSRQCREGWGCATCCGKTASKKTAGRRTGQVAMDYVLILGTLLPLCGILVMMGRRLIMLAYEMIGNMISWPFL